MLDVLKIRYKHGYQAVPDIKAAVIKNPYRGFPCITASKCNNCGKCVEQCPVSAITINPLKIDLGACINCGGCEKSCENTCIKWSNFHKTATTAREGLIINDNITSEVFVQNAVEVDKKLKSFFGRSLALRQVSAGGCNGCELELNACSNVNFDMGRFGINVVASPRHADAVLITGPITENMAQALQDTYACIPEPKLVIVAGTCAISGGIFKGSKALDREFLSKYKVDLYIPGCPVHPLTVINGMLALLGK